MEAWGDAHTISLPVAKRNSWLHCRTEEREGEQQARLLS